VVVHARSYTLSLCRTRFGVCSVRFVMKTDDDAFVNMHSLLPRLHRMAVADRISSSSSASSSSNMLLLCNAWRRELVARHGKWRIEPASWRYDRWPTFCQGLAFIMTKEFVSSAHQLVHRVPRLWLDDVRVNSAQIWGVNSTPRPDIKLDINPKFLYFPFSLLPPGKPVFRLLTGRFLLFGFVMFC